MPCAWACLCNGPIPLKRSLTEWKNVSINSQSDHARRNNECQNRKQGIKIQSTSTENSTWNSEWIFSVLSNRMCAKWFPNLKYELSYSISAYSLIDHYQHVGETYCHHTVPLRCSSKTPKILDESIIKSRLFFTLI